MALSDDIVILNEFTSKYNDAHGNTLNRYVMDYCDRPDAIQTVLPFNHGEQSIPDFLKNRVLMDELADAQQGQSMNFNTYQSLDDISHDLWNRQGVAFDQDNFSIDHDHLLDEANQVQDLFNSGHVVLKTVISFRTRYLQDKNIMNPDFQFLNYGDLFDQTDDLKLRAGIKNGVNRYCQRGQYSDPLWIGAYQFDRQHVHVHLVIADRGSLSTSKRLLTYMGQVQERGQINKRERNVIRNGIDDIFTLLKPQHCFTKVAEPLRTLNNSLQLSDNLIKTNNRNNLQILFMTDQMLRDRGQDFNRENLEEIYDTDHQRYVNGLLEDYAHQLGLPVDDAYGVIRNDIRDLTDNISSIDQSDSSMNWALKQRYLDPKIVNQPNILSITDQRLNQAGIVSNDRNRKLLKYQRLSDQFAGYIINFGQRRLLNQTSPDAELMDRYYQRELLYNGRLVDKYLFFNAFDASLNYRRQESNMNRRYSLLLEQRDDLFDQLSGRQEIGDASEFASDLLDDKQFNQRLDSWARKTYSRNVAEDVRNDLTKVSTGLIPSVSNRSLRTILTLTDKVKRRNVQQNLRQGQVISYHNLDPLMQQRLVRYQTSLDRYHLDLFRLGAISAERFVYDLSGSRGQQLMSPDRGSDPLIVLSAQGFNRNKGLNLSEELDSDLVKNSSLVSSDLDPEVIDSFSKMHRRRRSATDGAKTYLQNSHQSFQAVDQTDEQLQRELRLLQLFDDQEYRKEMRERLRNERQEEQQHQIQEVNEATSRGLSNSSLNNVVQQHINGMQSAINNSGIGR